MLACIEIGFYRLRHRSDVVPLSSALPTPQGLGATEIAKALGIGRVSVLRCWKPAKRPGQPYRSANVEPWTCAADAFRGAGVFGPRLPRVCKSRREGLRWRRLSCTIRKG